MEDNIRNPDRVYRDRLIGNDFNPPPSPPALSFDEQLQIALQSSADEYNKQMEAEIIRVSLQMEEERSAQCKQMKEMRSQSFSNLLSILKRTMPFDRINTDKYTFLINTIEMYMQLEINEMFLSQKEYIELFAFLGKIRVNQRQLDELKHIIQIKE
jgi:hypothetical protein